LKSEADPHSNLPPASRSPASSAKRPEPLSEGNAAGPSGTAPQQPRTTGAHALFLDVDGTLLSIAAHPDAVHVPAALLSLLERLETKLNGAVALISGRTISDLDGLFAPLKLPAAGIHGLERRGADGVVHQVAAAAQMDSLRAPLADFVDARDGLLLEDKQQSLALHYRNAPHYEAEIKTLLDRLVTESPVPLELKRGKMVIEVKPGGANKGTAIEAYMAEAPFAGRIPVFIGDDVTDEDGFRSVNRMGGLSIRVGYDADSAAVYALPDEDAVIAWLQPWAADGPQGGSC
jgi:trehalose 6-phosphate phosphatase